VAAGVMTTADLPNLMDELPAELICNKRHAKYKVSRSARLARSSLVYSCV